MQLALSGTLTNSISLPWLLPQEVEKDLYIVQIWTSHVEHNFPLQKSGNCYQSAVCFKEQRPEQLHCHPAARDVEKWKIARLQSSFHTLTVDGCTLRETHVWESFKPEVLSKPTLKGRSWCFKALNMVNHLMGLHFCSHWLSFQLRLWKCNAFMPCLHYRYCSKEVAYNKFILLPSSSLCSPLSTDHRNKMVQSHW